MSLSYRIRALWATEALNHNLAAPSLEAAIELEKRNQSMCCCAPEFIKAVEAFAKRRLP
ncbi:MAG: hypothetical protein Q7V48_03460 [Deltaproteobacteria bacterium]|nr:hypothetical protein [Deltaproteobacteria bacterium]